MWRGLSCVWVLAAACWSQDPLIDGAFTPEQWAQLQKMQMPAPPDPCANTSLRASACAVGIEIGDMMFHDPALSGGHCSISTATICFSNNDCPPTETCPYTPVSCASCHDQKNGWSDSRAVNNVSQGSVGWTKRNAMPLWNTAFKPDGHEFTWSGAYTTSGGVLDLAIKKPMSSTHAHVASLVWSNPQYAMLYPVIFGFDKNPETVFANLEQCFTAYLSSTPFITGVTPFDLWLAGKESPMTDSAKRGFALFVGKGTCISCHRGALFSDFDFHDTGVPQDGVHVPAVDNGLGDVTMTPADDGKFLTGMLREIGKSGPYMHDGVFQTLGDVIDFYRQGGVNGTFAGARDPKIQPLDLTDQDAKDLEAFLNSLTQCDGTTCPAMSGSGSGGPPIDAGVPVPHDAPGPACMQPQISCSGMCVDPLSDQMNCGGCGHICSPGQLCTMGVCTQPCLAQTCTSLNAQCGSIGDGCGNVLSCGMCPSPLACDPMNQCSCPPGASLCGTSCVDLQTDAANCGTCGHACVGSHVCSNGMCV